MDAAVALVQAYLRVNGYFTETEYPIVTRRKGEPVTLTDLDILAVRFPGAGRWIPHAKGRGLAVEVDPRLQVTQKRMDFIIGEVKQGRGGINSGTNSLPVIETVLHRFGCCESDPSKIARDLLRGLQPEIRVLEGIPCRMRMILFSGSKEPDPGPYQVIRLRQIVKFLSAYLRGYEKIFLHTKMKDDVLALVTLFTKLGFRL